ncbi:MAG: YaiI/YqxD family protein [Desulfobacteraceae bacterium]|nr:YaiI/YqxD family protein [Desulfobacteraceae bacterium]
MKIFVDGDACPNEIKQLVFDVSRRTKIKSVFVSNKQIKVPVSPFIETIIVAKENDAADNEIVKLAQKEDICVTSDIPLASFLIEKNCFVLSPFGELFTEENIRSKLNTRDFMDSLRGSGIMTKGGSPFSVKNKHLFSNNLDKIITRYLNRQKK